MELLKEIYGIVNSNFPYSFEKVRSIAYVIERAGNDMVRQLEAIDFAIKQTLPKDNLDLRTPPNVRRWKIVMQTWGRKHLDYARTLREKYSPEEVAERVQKEFRAISGMNEKAHLLLVFIVKK